MTMPDATAEEVIAMEWLHPHYATPDGQAADELPGLRGPGAGADDRGGLLHRRRARAGLRRVLRPARRLPRGSRKPRHQREDVDTVMCTHLHFDHVGWNTYKDPETGEYRPTFPNARYLFGRTEYDAWQNVHPPRRRAYRYPPGRMRRSDRRAGHGGLHRGRSRNRARHPLRAEPRPHAGPRPRAHRARNGERCGHHRRPDAPPDAVRHAAPRGDFRHGQGRRPQTRMGFVDKYPTAACW
jgi:hypothetical protein